MAATHTKGCIFHGYDADMEHLKLDGLQLDWGKVSPVQNEMSYTKWTTYHHQELSLEITLITPLYHHLLPG